jgi:hypothetical protein
VEEGGGEAEKEEGGEVAPIGEGLQFSAAGEDEKERKAPEIYQRIVQLN